MRTITRIVMVLMVIFSVGQLFAEEIDYQEVSFVSGTVKTLITLYVIPLFAFLLSKWLNSIKEKEILEILQEIWNIIVKVDHLFNDTMPTKANYYLEQQNNNYNLAKKLCAVDMIKESFDEEKKGLVLKRFKSLSWAVEAAFLVFKYGKKAIEVVK